MQTQTTAENSPKHPAPAVIPTPPPALRVARRRAKILKVSGRARARSREIFPPPSRVASSLPVEREATAFERSPLRSRRSASIAEPALERSPKPIPAPSGNLRPEARRAAVLSLLLLAGAAGAAVVSEWIPWLKPPKKPAVHAASAPRSAASSAPQKTAMAATDSGRPSQAGGASVLQPAVASRTQCRRLLCGCRKTFRLVCPRRSHWNGPDVHVAEVAPGSVVAPLRQSESSPFLR